MFEEKAPKSLMPKQVRSVSRKEKMDSLAGAKTDAVCAAGWLDILGKAAKGALGAVMG